MEENDLKIYLDIQKPYYYPGEQILGSILIEFFNSINCNQITIISKGKKKNKNKKKIKEKKEEKIIDFVVDDDRDGGWETITNKKEDNKKKQEQRQEDLEKTKKIYNDYLSHF